MASTLRPDACVVCQRAIGDDGCARDAFSCHHRYHLFCLERWTAVQEGLVDVSRCAICKKPALCLGDDASCPIDLD